MPRHRRAHEGQSVVHVCATAAWLDFDASPNVPTLEEIEIADDLRHGLELKYFGKADPCRDSGTAHPRQATDMDA